MAGEKGDLVDRLGEVKDAIGEWHDLTVLSSVAKDSLKKSEGRSVVRQIEDITKQKEQRAHELANRLRNQYFNDGRKNGRQSRGKGIHSARVLSRYLLSSGLIPACARCGRLRRNDGSLIWDQVAPELIAGLREVKEIVCLSSFSTRSEA